MTRFSAGKWEREGEKKFKTKAIPLRESIENSLKMIWKITRDYEKKQETNGHEKI